MRRSSVLPMLILAACGSSSKTGGEDDPSATVDNQGLSGALYLSSATGYVELDIATGVAVQLRAHGGGAPSSDGTELAGVVFDASELLDGDSYDTELVIFQRDGRTVARFGRGGFMYGPRLSPDKQRVAFEYHSVDEGDAGGVDILNVTDRAGDLLARYEGATWWDWAPDGSLYVSAGDTIYRVGPTLGDGVPVKQFPNDAPTNLAVSPDGQQLAFGLGDRGTLKNHVYVMNIDGTGVRQLTTSDLNEDAPAWSPDGKTLAVRQGIAYSAQGAGIPGGGCPEIWLVPEGSTALELGSSNAKYKMQMLEDGAVRAACAFSSPAWRMPPAYERNDGTPISGGGANNGLTGKLVYEEPDQVVALDLAHGELSSWTKLGGSPDVSRDGSELLIRARQPSSGDSDDAELSFLDTSGVVRNSILVTGSLMGPARLSYDGAHAAVAYNGPSDGSKWIVSIFDRQANLLTRLPPRYDIFTWAPDGRMIAVVGNLMTITDATFTKLSELATFGDAVSGPAVSPDGTRIAFTMNGHVWIMKSDGSELRQLTLSGSSESSPEWSPDGTQVLVRYETACPRLYAVPADGTRVFVGNPDVRTSAVAIYHDERGAQRTTCAFSRPNWR